MVPMWITLNEPFEVMAFGYGLGGCSPYGVGGAATQDATLRSTHSPP